MRIPCLTCPLRTFPPGPRAVVRRADALKLGVSRPVTHAFALRLEASSPWPSRCVLMATTQGPNETGPYICTEASSLPLPLSRLGLGRKGGLVSPRPAPGAPAGALTPPPPQHRAPPAGDPESAFPTARRAGRPGRRAPVPPWDGPPAPQALRARGISVVYRRVCFSCRANHTSTADPEPGFCGCFRGPAGSTDAVTNTPRMSQDDSSAGS